MDSIELLSSVSLFMICYYVCVWLVIIKLIEGFFGGIGHTYLTD